MKRACSLCGGKLRDGICTECGMDNRKSDEMYRTTLNQSDCEHRSLSHVHDEKSSMPYKRPVMNKTREPDCESAQDGSARKQEKFQRRQVSGTYTPKTFSRAGSSSSSSGMKPQTLTAVILVCIVVFVLAAVILVQESKQTSIPEAGWSAEWHVEEMNPERYDPYAELEEELNPTGEIWEMEMPAGMYVVGVDIPEGEYLLTGKAGSSYDVYDAEHLLAVHEMFGTDEYQILQAEGVKLFAGAVVCVDGLFPVKFYTENAQIQNMSERTVNPLTEEIEISGKSLAGEDFPEGTYDIYAVGEAFGIFQFELELVREDYTVPFSLSIFMEENPTEEHPEYCSVYRNVVLPKGTSVDSEEMTIKLVPSEGIITQEYLDFYKNMY